MPSRRVTRVTSRGKEPPRSSKNGRRGSRAAPAARANDRSRDYDRLLGHPAVRLACERQSLQDATHGRLLGQYGLLACFTHTVFCGETRVRKPEPAIFLGALRALGADPARAIHVGDDAILDVEGARAAGMRVVQVTSASTSSVGGRRPDAVVPTLAALPEAIARLDR